MDTGGLVELRRPSHSQLRYTSISALGQIIFPFFFNGRRAIFAEYID